MAVEVSLLKLLKVPDSRDAWPEEFVGLFAKLEETPGERSQWGIVADWCREHGEIELADALNWVQRHTNIHVRKSRDGWYANSLPTAFALGSAGIGDMETLAEWVAGFTAALGRAREKAKALAAEVE